MENATPGPDPPLEALLARFRSGDTEALAGIFDATAPGLFRTALHLAPDAAAAEDALQETFLAFLLAAREGAPIREVAPWLAGTLRNRVLRGRRTGGRAPDPLRLEPRILETDPPTEAARAEEIERVRRALDGLPEPYREPAILRWRYGMEPAAIAHARGVPPGTVRSLLSRAADRLRVALGSIFVSYFHTRPPRGLESVRGDLLRAARAGAPAGTTTAAGAAAVLGGLLVAKKTVAAVVVVALLLLGGGWVARRGAGGGASPPAVGGPAATVGTAPRAAAAPPVRGKEPPASPAGGPAPTPGGPAPATGTTGSILVRAFWSDDTPAAGIGVVVLPWSGTQRVWRARPAVTGADGTARLEGLAPGKVGVRSDRNGYAQVVVRAGTETTAVLRHEAGVTVQGTVADAEDRPVPGATIAIEGSALTEVGPPAAVAGPDGTFRLRGLPPLSEIGARASGHVPSAASLIRGEPGARVDVLLRLRGPGSALAGRVLDAAGETVPGAFVRVGPGSEDGRTLASTSDGKWVYARALRGAMLRTDSEGRFRAEGVEPGLVPVAVAARGHAPWKDRVPVPADRPGTIEIRLQDGGSVAGTLAGADGSPAANVPVQALGVGGVFFPSTATGDDGSWCIEDLCPGEYHLLADGYARGRAEARVVVKAGLEARWDARLEAGLALRGLVEGEGGLPRAGWSVLVCNEDPGSTTMETFIGKYVATDAGGRFEVPACPAEPLRVAVFAPGCRDFPVLRRRGVRAAAEDLVLAVPDALLPSAFVVGSVLGPDGRPLPAARVQLVPPGQPGEAREFDLEPASARFRLGPLPPGPWEMEIRAEGVATRRFGTLELGPGESRDLGAVRFTGAAFVAVRLRKEGGTVPGSVHLRFFTEEGLAESSNSAPVVEGAVRFGPILPGTYDLSVQENAPRESYGRTTVTVAGEGDTRCDLQLLPGRRHFIHLGLPAGSEEAAQARVTVRDAAGAVVLEDLAAASGQFDENRRWVRLPGLSCMVTLAPGTYRVEAACPGGPKGSGTVVVPEAGGPGVTEIPLR
jgi:RNA polymerase sigma-70 factor (ECF subfamily)